MTQPGNFAGNKLAHDATTTEPALPLDAPKRPNLGSIAIPESLHPPSTPGDDTGLHQEATRVATEDLGVDSLVPEDTRTEAERVGDQGLPPEDLRP